MLQPRHMSGDECKTAQDMLLNIWVIVEAEWQSDPLKLLLRKLDVLYQVYRLKSGRIGGDGKESFGRGRGPRTRVSRPDGRIVNSEAPVGLWRNCYNPDWLKKLRPHNIKELHIVDEDYDFTLDMDKHLSRNFQAGDDNMDIENELGSSEDGGSSGAGNAEGGDNAKGGANGEGGVGNGGEGEE